MQDQIYREIILEHWKNPQNYGIIAAADIDMTDLNPLCGDEIHITARIKDNSIAEVAFESQGCAISRASASLYLEEIKGKLVSEVQKRTQQEVLNLLEVELTPARTKCALLVYVALNKGLADRRSSGSFTRHTK